MDTGPPEVNNS